MICPSCGHDVEVVGVDIAPPLAICPDCERSLVVIEGRARLATAADVTDITPDDKAALSQLRIDTRRARKAYYQQHHR